MGIPMNYGSCRGGPWDKKQMAHATPTYNVVIEDGRKGLAPVPGKQVVDQTVSYGTYIWNPEDKAWDWRPPGGA